MPNLQKLLIEVSGTSEELLAAYHKIKDILLTEGTNFESDVKAILDGAVHDGEHAIAIIEHWKKEHPQRANAPDDPPDPNPNDPPA